MGVKDYWNTQLPGRQGILRLLRPPDPRRPPERPLPGRLPEPGRLHGEVLEHPPRPRRRLVNGRACRSVRGLPELHGVDQVGHVAPQHGHQADGAGQGEHPRRGRRRRGRLPERAARLRRRREHRAQGCRRRPTRRGCEDLQGRCGRGALYDVGGPASEPSTVASLAPRPLLRDSFPYLADPWDGFNNPSKQNIPQPVMAGRSRREAVEGWKEGRRAMGMVTLISTDCASASAPGRGPVGRACRSAEEPSRAVLVNVGEHTGALVLARPRAARVSRWRSTRSSTPERTHVWVLPRQGGRPRSMPPCSPAFRRATTPCIGPDGSVTAVVPVPANKVTSASWS